MRLNELLSKLEGFEEVESDRSYFGHGVRKIGGGDRTVDYKWFKFQSPTGSTVYVKSFDRPEDNVRNFEILFPSIFEDRYWETIEKIAEASEITFHEKQRNDFDGVKHEHYADNHQYVEQIRRLHDSLLGQVNFLVKRSLGDKHIKDDRFKEPIIGYLDRTRDRLEKLEGGKNFKLIMSFPERFGGITETTGVRDLAGAIDAFEGIAESTSNEWQSIEDATVAYALHLKEIYKPIV